MGVIGGSGLYELPGLGDVERRARARRRSAIRPTRSSSAGSATTRLVFLPRHGRGHRLLPSELPFRANLWALKSLGVEWVLAVSAVGSLREEIAPGHVVVPDQFIDRTRGRPPRARSSAAASSRTCSSPIPFCPTLSRALADAARAERRDRPRRAAPTSAWRARVLDARRVAPLPQLGRARDRHDQPAGGEARARGRALLRDARARHRLRLLERRPRTTSTIDDILPVHRRQRRAGAAHGRARSRRALPARDGLPVPRGARARHHHRSRRDPGRREARPGADRREVPVSARDRRRRLGRLRHHRDARAVAPIDVLGGAATHFAVAASFFAPVAPGRRGRRRLPAGRARLPRRDAASTSPARASRRGTSLRWHRPLPRGHERPRHARASSSTCSPASRRRSPTPPAHAPFVFLGEHRARRSRRGVLEQFGGAAPRRPATR